MRLLESRAGPLGEKIIYSGEKITFFPGKNVILIRGQACVENGPQRVSSDSLIAYNRNTGEIYVSGSPQLTDGPDQLTGSRVRYNMERARGIIEQRTVFSAKKVFLPPATWRKPNISTSKAPGSRLSATSAPLPPRLF